MSDLIKIRPLRDEMSHADGWVGGRTDGQTKDTHDKACSLLSKFYERA